MSKLRWAAEGHFEQILKASSLILFWLLPVTDAAAMLSVSCVYDGHVVPGCLLLYDVTTSYTYVFGGDDDASLQAGDEVERDNCHYGQDSGD